MPRIPIAASCPRRAAHALSPALEVAAGPLHAAGKWQGDAPAGETAVRNDTGVYEGGEISCITTR